MCEINIHQVVDAHRLALDRVMSLRLSEDGTKIVIGKKRFRSKMLTVLAYLIMFLTVLSMWAAVTLYYWMLAISCPFVVLLCIYMVRHQTQTVIFDFPKSMVTIKGVWQKTVFFPWSAYRENEIVCSIMDFPEEFYIIFQKGSKTCKIKLADVTPVLHKYNPENFSAIKKLWECVEFTMSPKEDVAFEEIPNI